MKDEPAFPVDEYTVRPGLPPSYEGKSFGLTKREYFAGLAMQGLLANGDHRKRLACDLDTTHICAIKYADALLKELAKDD